MTNFLVKGERKSYYDNFVEWKYLIFLISFLLWNIWGCSFPTPTPWRHSRCSWYPPRFYKYDTISVFYPPDLFVKIFIGVIWIITSLLKINISSKQNHKVAFILQHELCLHINTACDMWCTSTDLCPMNMQLHQLLHALFIYCLVMDGRSFCQNQLNCLSTC